MPSASASRGRDSTPRRSGLRSWLGHRLAELAGFLVSVLGLLILLSLISYQPWDPSLNTTSAGPSASNWIGLWGSYSADALFQALGWAAYVLPLVLFVVGIQMLRARAFEAPWTKFVGILLLLGSLTALLELYPYTPAIHGMAAGAVRGSGLVGYLVALVLRSTFNGVGAAIVAATVFLSSLFLVTRFSFSAAFSFLLAHFNFVKALVARFS
ncbi:MAG TPA: DNA translocase FtsK 4TM domain-containing protein, partial [Steroidobacteraceae bacterium]